MTDREREAVAELASLRNIGEHSARLMVETGIESREHVEALGAAEVYTRLKARYPVSRTMLWALQGALLDLPWQDLPGELRQALLAELGDA